MSKETQSSCSHGQCNCSVPDGETYCSEHCRQADLSEGSVADEMTEACGCGHPDCDQA